MKSFLEYCRASKRKHRMTMKPCPACGGRSGELVPQPVSDKIDCTCGLNHICTGCEAYEEHLR